MFSWMVVFSKKCGWLLQCHNSRPESTDFTLLSSLSFSSTATNRKRLERIFGRGNSTLHTTLSIHLYFSFLYLSSLHFQFFFKARSCVPFNCMSFEFRSSEEAEIGSSYNNQTETIANKIYVKYPSISIAILVHKK